MLIAAMKGKTPSKPYQFLRRWRQAYDAGRFFTDARRRRRKRKLSPEEVEVASAIFLAGYKEKGMEFRLPYSSLNQALHSNKELASILSRTQASTKTLWRAIKEARPAMKSRSLEVYQPMSAGQKKARLARCKTLMRMGKKQLSAFLRRVVWIDAAKIWVAVDKNNKVWVDVTSNNMLQLADTRAPGKRSARVCLAYYAPVNSEIGPVNLGMTAGTQGVPESVFSPAKVTTLTPSAPLGL